MTFSELLPLVAVGLYESVCFHDGLIQTETQNKQVQITFEDIPVIHGIVNYWIKVLACTESDVTFSSIFRLISVLDTLQSLCGCSHVNCSLNEFIGTVQIITNKIKRKKYHNLSNFMSLLFIMSTTLCHIYLNCSAGSETHCCFDLIGCRLEAVHQ